MLLETLVAATVKACSTNSTDNGFASKVPTATAPSGTGVIDIAGSAYIGSTTSGNVYRIVPYGTASNNNTMNMRIYGWDVIGNNPDTLEWFPVLLAQFALTIGNIAGTGTRQIASTELFCDTITLTYPTITPASIEYCSNAADLIAHVVVDAKGFKKLEITFDRNSSATDCNALVTPY